MCDLKETFILSPFWRPGVAGGIRPTQGVCRATPPRSALGKDSRLFELLVTPGNLGVPWFIPALFQDLPYCHIPLIPGVWMSLCVPSSS